MITKILIEPTVGNLQQQTDLNLVCDGAPAYLLMLDSMLVSNPDNPTLLMTALQSYGGYSGAIGECQQFTKERMKAMGDKSRLYGLRLLNHFITQLPHPGDKNLEKTLASLTADDVPFVFWGTFGWLNWVQSQNGSPAAIADLVIIEKIMARLLELDEAYQGGSIHLFFGVYHAAKPAMFGGKPELSKDHFEKAIQLSSGSFLLSQVSYAETYARATFNQELHDRLLNEVLQYPLEDRPEYGLSNRIAVNKAIRLLEEDYFGE